MTTRFVRAAVLAALAMGCGSDGEAGPTTQPEPYPPPAPDDCITSVEPGHQTLTCEALSFELTVPAVCLERACGLIVDVHGFGMNGPLMELHSKLSVLAEGPGYILVQPSAPGMLLSSSWSGAHDAQVFAIMQHVMSVWHVDAKRIHFDRYSQGGWMTRRAASCSVVDLSPGTAFQGAVSFSAAAPRTPGTGARPCSTSSSATRSVEGRWGWLPRC
jgi:poly(3-hydroxybutyrate) depolymerase